MLLKHELIILFRTDSNIDTNFLESTKESPQTFYSKVRYLAICHKLNLCNYC